MSALSLTIQTLLAGSGITALAGQRIYPVYAPQNAGYPNVVVHLIHSDEEVLLQGATQWPNARVSIECRGAGDTPLPDADRLAEAVVNWLRDKHLYTGVSGYEATFLKEGSDETDASDENDAGGNPSVVRRILDYYVQYRAG